MQNFPNPFNPSTVIAYELPRPARVRIEIFNVLGRRIRTLFDGFQPNRRNEAVWDATDDAGRGVTAGVYIYLLRADGIRIGRKMLLLDGHQGLSKGTWSRPVDVDASGEAVLDKPVSFQGTLRVTGGDIETFEQENIEVSGETILDVTVFRTVKDIDGNAYRTVKIGDQWWMAENLKVTHYRNGDEIPHVTDGAEWDDNVVKGKVMYCYYNNDPQNLAVYGCLYNWMTVSDSRNIAPAGWHVASDAEWKEMEMFLGMSQEDADWAGWLIIHHDGTRRGRGTIGGKLRETGRTHWRGPNTSATNESGFTALPGGIYLGTDGFFMIRDIAHFWTSTGFSTTGAWERQIDQSPEIGRSANGIGIGNSVRCIKD